MGKEFSIIFSALINLILGLIVYRNNPKNKINKSFFLFTISIFIWSIALFFYTHPVYFEALWWIKMTYFFSCFIPFTAFYFVANFSEKNPEFMYKMLRIYWFCFLPFILILFFTDWWVKDVVSEPWGMHTIVGPAYPFFAILVAIYSSWFFLILLQKHGKSEREKKLQIEYMFIGCALFGIFGFTLDIVLPIFIGISKYFWVSPIAVLFFVSFTALAVLRYHLFEIRIILTELLVGVMGFILALPIFTAVTFWGRILNTVVFLLFCIFGYFLIRATHQEVKRREEAERLSEAKSEFISIASHQLRTPLSAMKGYISMILEKTYGELPGKMEKPLKSISTSTERLIKLVNDLLNVSRIEIGKMEMNWEKLDLGKIIENVIEEMRIRVEEKNLYLKFERMKDKFPKILLDREKIRQVIVNVLDNSIHYTKKGGITIKLKIENSKLKIIVSDTGEGMTEKEISQLFESFSRGSAGQKFWTEGAGLGLYIAKKFVEMHNGKIWAESPGKGKGSMFFIELPMK